jgi:hypothetical protein
MHQYGDAYIVSDSSVKLSAKFSKKISETLKHTYAQRISPGAILALQSFDLALAMRKVGDGYRKTVRLTVTGLHGRGLHSSKGIINAKSIQSLEKLDFVTEFFNSRELSLSQSESLAAIPPQIAPSSFSRQLPAPAKVDERSPITNDVQEDPPAPPDAPGAVSTVARPDRAEDHVADVTVVQDVTPAGVISQNIVRGEGAWIRDSPQSMPHWGVSGLVLH